jgi:hypothetical protein
MEQQMRKSNVRSFGLPEKQDDNCAGKITSLLKKKLKVNGFRV